MLADYARLAITKIKHDVITTYSNAEWKGETNLTLEAPKTALDWVRKTTAWKLPQFEFNTPPIRLDTRKFEEAIKKEMIQLMKIDGVRKSDSNEEHCLREMLYGDDGKSNGNNGGLDRDGVLFNRLDDLFPKKTQPNTGREVWFRCNDRLE